MIIAQVSKLKFLVPILIGVVVICAIIIELKLCVSAHPRKEQFYTETGVISGFLVDDIVIFSFTPQKEMESAAYNVIKAFSISSNDQGFIKNPGSWRNEAFHVLMTLVLERTMTLGNIFKLKIFRRFIVADFTVRANNRVGRSISVIPPVRPEFPYNLLMVECDGVDGFLCFFFESNTPEKNERSLSFGGEFVGTPQGESLKRADRYQKTCKDNKQPIGEAKIPPTDILGIVALVGTLGSFWLQFWGLVRFDDGRRWSGGVIYCIGILLLAVSLLGLLFG